MPKAVRTISCCYCDASTMIDLTRVGRGVLTCDACGARLASARMEAVVNKPVPVRHDPARRVCGGWGGAVPGGTLDSRWRGRADGSAAGAGIARPKKKKKSGPKKRKGFLDRLEDMWDEIEDIGDDIKDLWD